MNSKYIWSTLGFRFIKDAAGLRLSNFRITATLVMMISSILCVIRGCCLIGAPKNNKTLLTFMSLAINIITNRYIPDVLYYSSVNVSSG